MKRFLSVLATVIGGIVFFGIGGVVYYLATYYSQHNALLAEIQKHPRLQIVDHWRHEDMTLEDFGFAVRSERVTAFVNISDGSNVRLPHDRAIGIRLSVGDKSHRVGNTVYGVDRVILFDSAEWRERGLPKVETIAGLLAHFDSIAYSLLSDPPLTKSWEPNRDLIYLEGARGRQRSRGPAKRESKLW